MIDTVAAVDLGSNSFHMIVSRLTNTGDLQVIDRIREGVRLAEGLETNKSIHPDAMARALECLERFGQRLAPLPAECVRVVGTNTLRRSRNSKAFLEQIETALGHSVDVISGAEEARLIYAGVAPDIDPKLNKRLVVDIGGGSTEIICGEGLEPVRIESLGLGCVSHTQRFFADGTLTRKAWNKAITAASLQLEPHVRAYRKQGWDIALGTSGTIRAVFNILKSHQWATGSITPKGLKQLRNKILGFEHINDIALEGLSSRRQGVIIGGLAVLSAVFDALKIDRMEVSDRALRDGLLYDLVGRLHDKDVRSRSVAAMAARYEVDTEHAEEVANSACALLEQCQTAWKLPKPSSRQLLRWAAYLHEIGLVITHSKYNHHSAYLVRHSDLEGFSQNQQRQLAAMVHLHRGKFDLQVLEEVANRDTEITTRLAAILRLAVLLHRGRNSEDAPGFSASAGASSLSLKFCPDWLQEHPLTRADLEQERLYLKSCGLKLIIKRASKS